MVPISLDEKWITSKEILVKTGISRATLNNYIKMEILPKPVVKRAGADQKGVKQIGYFPETVLERIGMVKRLKSEGYSMDEITKMFVESPISAPPTRKQPEDENSVSNSSEIKSMEDIAKKFEGVSPPDERFYSTPPVEQPISDKIAPSRRDDDAGLKLSIGEIHTPAYLINHNFEIEWINKEAEEQIFNKSIKSIVDVESRNIFKLCFSWEFHSHLRNWEEIIAAHMSVIKSKIDKNNIVNLYNGISDKEIQFLERIYDLEVTLSEESIHHTPITFARQDGKSKTFQIYTISFREGIFFVYIPTDQVNHNLMKLLSNRGKIITELLNQRMASLVSLCILVADIQDSVKICAELPPEEYFQLVNALYKTVGESFEKHNGIYGKHAGDGMLYYFIKKPGTNYIVDAIDCALEIREKVMEFSSGWKLKKGWFNDIYLNIAINEGQEFFGAIHSSSNVEFTALGDSINYTGRLSDFARYGSIWTTKNVISKLTQEERRKIRFGVYRKQKNHQVFLPNSFSRIIELASEMDSDYSRFLDIATLPITEIVEKID